MKIKRIDFEIRGHQYSYYFDDWRDVFHDVAQKEKFKRGNIKGMDLAPLIRQLTKHAK